MIYTAPGQVSTLAVEWIEIRLHHGQITVMVVSTLAVEWIEIHHYRITITSIWMSPPSRWSGLKWQLISKWGTMSIVSTLAVEWIEI